MSTHRAVFLCLGLVGALLALSAVALDAPHQSPNDKREYKFVTLDNGLIVPHFVKIYYYNTFAGSPFGFVELEAL